MRRIASGVEAGRAVAEVVEHAAETVLPRALDPHVEPPVHCPPPPVAQRTVEPTPDCESPAYGVPVPRPPGVGPASTVR